MKKNKKNLKGMTLYEMIISIAIFAIMCLVLIGVGVHIDNTSRATTNLKNKIVAESQFAANKVKKGDFNEQDITITVKYKGDTQNVAAEKYNTETAFTGDKDKNVDEGSGNEDKAGTAEFPDSKYNEGLNLEFVVIK